MSDTAVSHDTGGSVTTLSSWFSYFQVLLFSKSDTAVSHDTGGRVTALSHQNSLFLVSNHALYLHNLKHYQHKIKSNGKTTKTRKSNTPNSNTKVNKTN